MDTLLQVLKQKTQEALQRAFSQEIVPDVAQSTQAQFGHYQCNNALKLAKELRESPREVAQKIASHFALMAEDGTVMIDKIEIAGPGFLNITLDTNFLSKEVNKQLKDPRLGVSLPAKRQRIVVDFSSPNIAKELHVGHLRSTIIGESIARLFEFLGHDVLRLNHIGDWGTQFGMLIAYLKEEKQDVLSGKEKGDLVSFMEWYKLSKKRFDADPEFKKKAQLEIVKLQSGDPNSLATWRMICDLSRLGFEEIYQLLDVKIEERGESFYNPFLAPLIADLEKKGLITLSDGAKCIFLEGFVSREGTPLPMIVQKSDGGYNYDTTDLATIRHRIKEERADRVIYVTDAGQALHFQMLFKVAEKAGYLDPRHTRVDHVSFGVVLGADGKKFKTRAGGTEKLIDLLLEAISRAKGVIRERLGDVAEAELEEMANVLGLGSVKYADLSSHRIKDYVFSYDRMLRFEGNTAPFILYAYVRTKGIQRKIGKSVEALMRGSATIQLEHPTEIALGLHLRRFGEVLEVVADLLTPHQLCEYLFELAEKFHAFFRDCRVEGSSLEDSRLLLCELTARALKQGLEILGLKTLERM